MKDEVVSVESVAVLAKRMPVEFTAERSAGGDVLHGNAGDWLVQYAPGDHGIVAAARFDSVYRKSARNGTLCLSRTDRDSVMGSCPS